MSVTNQPGCGGMKPVEILLVEDCAGDTLLVSQILKDSAIPVNLHVARDGAQAMLMLADRDFQLIILDLNMPGVSGYEVLQRNQSRNIPTVVFTSSSKTSDREWALVLGAREYIEKPTDLGLFSEAVRGILERWVRPEQSANASDAAGS